MSRTGIYPLNIHISIHKFVVFIYHQIWTKYSNQTLLLKIRNDGINYYHCVVVSAVKINILTRINYLSDMTPVNMPHSLFSSLNSAVSSFYWEDRRPPRNPQIFKFISLLPVTPDAVLYIWHWTNQTHPSCLDIEQIITHEIPVENLPFIDNTSKITPVSNVQPATPPESGWWKANGIISHLFWGLLSFQHGRRGE